MTARGRVPVAGPYAGPVGGPPHQTATFRTRLLIAGLQVLLVAASCSSEELQKTPARAVASRAVIASSTPVPATATAPASTPSPVSTATAMATPEPTPTPRPAVRAAHLKKMQVEPAFPDLEFDQQVDLTYADDGTDRLFLVLQPGRIMVFRNDRDVGSAKTFLDIRARVNDRGSEEGLLGLAFDPHYRTNGYFYVYYSASSPRRSVISRFAVSDDDPDRADADSERVVLEVPQPFSNHNGGKVVFGPDGYLYLGLGDGGSGGDPKGNGQNRSTLLGTILRIDVRPVASEAAYVVPPDNPFAGGGEAREEIWAYGLRNPWRFTFDRETGDLWAADVGQNRYEEIDVIKPGLNYGWNRMDPDSPPKIVGMAFVGLQQVWGVNRGVDRALRGVSVRIGNG